MTIATALSPEDLVHELATVPAGHPSRPAMRDRAIEAWLPLARHLAKRYSGRGEPADDLRQVATIGLIKAIDRYDPARKIDFAGFAVPTIAGELKRHFRDRTWSVRVPRRLQERRSAITAANDLLTHTLGRSPTVTDMAAHLGITEDEVIEGLEGARAYNTASLSLPVGEDSGTTLADTIGFHDTGFETAELRAELGPALAALNAREQQIITLRFYANMSQSQIAGHIGISQMHVSRLLTKALATLRRQVSDES